jgi:hypothetical protein
MTDNLLELERKTAYNLAQVTQMLRNFPNTDRDYNLGKQAAYDVTLHAIRNEIGRQERIITAALVELEGVVA